MRKKRNSQNAEDRAYSNDTPKQAEVEESLSPNEQILIGNYLKEKREQKDLSLQMISQHTKISTTILENIEMNNFNDLPGIAYVSGFVKAYSKVIGAQQEEALQILNNNYVAIGKEAPEIMPEDSILNRDLSKDSDSISSSQLPYLIAGVFIILVILVTVLTGGDDQTEKGESTNNSKIKTAPVVATTLNAKTPLINSNVIDVKKVIEKEKVVEKEKVIEKEKTTEKEEGKEKIKFSSFLLPLYTKASLTEEEMESFLPTNYRHDKKDHRQGVFINAINGDTWLTYKKDDGPVKKFILKKGHKIFIRGKVVRLFLGNVHVTKIFLDNVPLNIKSRSGVKSLVFPQEKSKDYKIPLFIYRTDGSAIASDEYQE